MTRIIETNDGSRYKKPGFLTSYGATAAGNTAFVAASMPMIPVTDYAIKNMRALNRGVDQVEISKAIKDAMRITGMKDKGVNLIKFSPIKNLSKNEVISGFMDFMRELSKRPVNPKKPFNMLNAFNNLSIRLIKYGYNAGFNPKNNSVCINVEKMGTSAFHEIGHAINYNSSKFWRVMQKMRGPMMLLGALIPTIALFKRKKAPGEKPQGVVDKVTTFIKDNVGKLTALSFVPIIAEELKATARGNVLAKELLSPELFKKVVKSNKLGALTYVATAVATGVGAYLANKVRDAIAKPKKIA